MNPAGKIISSNVQSGVFGHFMDWPSIDWLGNSLFSQGGGFFPVKNKDDFSTVLYIPINQTGTHTILTHTTLFAGDSVNEPLTLVAKFTDLLSSSVVSLPSDGKGVIPKIIQSDNTSLTEIVPFDDTLESDEQFLNPLNVGLIIGISLGLGIGLVGVFIFRSKNDSIKQDL
jgi:hypothetical protein